LIDSNFPHYALVFLFTFIITVLLERLLIPKLKEKAKQPIYKEGPKWHISKSGTPTMGGLAFSLAITLMLSVGAVFLYVKGFTKEALSLLLCLLFSIFNSVIGIIDDYCKLKRNENAGLTPMQKIIAQSVIALLFLFSRAMLLDEKSVLSFSFGSFDIGILYYPLTFIILLGITNCANLTDGIDGLASGVAFAISVSLFYISCALSYEVSFISSAVMGATVSFLVFNLHPAKIFMGDTGSLLLGALLASASVALGNPLVIVFVGGIYVLEGVSVILQVLYYKLTKKRLFKMSPFHHHLEKSGWSENRICIVAIITTFLFSIPAFIFYLP